MRFSKLVPVTLGLVAFCAALQMPLLDNFQIVDKDYKEVVNQFKSFFQNPKPDNHYSTKDISQLPIDLSQYENHKIIRFYYDETNHKIIEELRKNYDQWEHNQEFIDLKIPDSDLSTIKEVGNHKIIIDDLAQTIYETYPKPEGTDFKINKESDFHTESDIFFKEYRPLSTIYAWLDILKETYPDLVEIEWLGQSYEGRDLKALHLSSQTGLNPTKKTIVMTAGVHAREWISVSTVLFTIYQLLSKYGSSKKETNFLNQLDFLIIPVFNPDGYEYTWTTDRLWRKNRQETYIPRCFGIDIDHSFGYHWTRSEDFPCGESYSGEAQFEAMEAENLDHYVNITKPDHIIYGFLDFHSYTQKILYPYAYSCDEYPRDIENLLELAYGLAKSIRLKSGKHYEVLPACKDRGVDLLPGLGAGSSLDYMYHNRAHWAFQLKLRDTGSHGFLLPSKFIIPVGKEIYSAVKYFCQFILNPDL